jgi:hypothetical protein
MLKRTRT